MLIYRHFLALTARGLWPPSELTGSVMRHLSKPRLEPYLSGLVSTWYNFIQFPVPQGTVCVSEDTST